jgi:hypothetical protein
MALVLPLADCVQRPTLSTLSKYRPSSGPYSMPFAQGEWRRGWPCPGVGSSRQSYGPVFFLTFDMNDDVTTHVCGRAWSDRDNSADMENFSLKEVNGTDTYHEDPSWMSSQNRVAGVGFPLVLYSWESWGLVYYLDHTARWLNTSYVMTKSRSRLTTSSCICR